MNHQDIGDLSVDGTLVLSKRATHWYVWTAGQCFYEDEAAARAYAQEHGGSVQGRRASIWEPVPEGKVVK